MSLLSARNSKGTHPHSQSLTLLTDTQSACLKSPLLDTEVFLLNLTECFTPLDSEACPGCRVLDNFPDHISFHPCDHLQKSFHKAHLEALDHLCHRASSDSSTLVVVTDASVIPPRNMQAISAMHFWRLGEQVLLSKVSAGRTTALDTELFTVRLGVAKAVSFDIKHIILITDSLSATRRAVDPLVHSGQAHSLAIVCALRGFFTGQPDHSIDFWDCPSNVQWSLHHLVHDNVTNTCITAGHHPATSLDTLCSKSTASCLDAWRTSFSCPSSQGCHFLPLKDGNHKSLQPSYTKGDSWLPFIGELVTLYARATQAILNHAPIGEFRQCFFPAECTQCLYGYCQVEICQHILANCCQFSHTSLIDPLLSLKDFVKFLKEHPSAFAFTSQDCLLSEPP